MAKQKIEIEITTPVNITMAEAVRLFTDHHNYQEKVIDENGDLIDNPQSRGAYAKATIARLVKEAIKTQRRMEAEKALELLGEVEVN